MLLHNLRPTWLRPTHLVLGFVLSQAETFEAAAFALRSKSGAFSRREYSSKSRGTPFQWRSSTVSKTGTSVRRVASLRNNKASSQAANNASDSVRALRIDGGPASHSWEMSSR